MFKADDVQHTLIPVAGKADLQSAFADQADQVNLVEQGRALYKCDHLDIRLNVVEN